jgi:outer membrane protein assembly factor BamB
MLLEFMYNIHMRTYSTTNVISIGLVFILLMLLAACGGGGGQANQLARRDSGQIDTKAGGPAKPGISPLTGNQNFTLELPGTLPPTPDDVPGLMARSLAHAAASKAASAVMSEVNRITITAVPTGTSVPDYAHSFAFNDDGTGGPVWVEAQRNTASGGAVDEYNIRGSVYNLDLNGMSYAQIGLVTYFCYDYAINLSENAPNSSYMFNQNLYMLLYYDDGIVSGNPAGYYARMSDMNGLASPAVGPLPTGAGGDIAFDFQVRLSPLSNSPVEQWSTPAGGPYTDHNCGDATLTVWPEASSWVAGSELFATQFQTYGTDNWGWRTAVGPELYDLASGGCALLGQVYSLNAGNSATLEFDATLYSGPPQSDDRDWWYAAGRDTNHDSAELLTGPLTPTVWWTYSPALASSNTISAPVLDQLGNIYYGTNAGVQGVTPTGTALAGWPTETAHDYQLATPHVSATYNPLGNSGWLYAGYRDASRYIQALGPDGLVRWTYHVAPASGTAYIGITEANSMVYLSQAAPNNHFVTLNMLTGLVANSYNVPAARSPLGITNPAVGSNGNVYITGNTSVLAFSPAGNFLYSYNLTGNCRNSTVSIAPDGALFVADASGTLHSLIDNGTALVINAGFNAPLGSKPGITSPGITAIYGTTASYILFTYDSAHSQIVATSNAGAELWRTVLPAAPAGAFAVGADGILYVAMQSAASTVQAFNPVDGSALWPSAVTLGSPALTGPALGIEAGDSDGRHSLYVATADGKLHAINDRSLNLLIDCHALQNCLFTVYNAATGNPVSPATINLDTDVIYDVSYLLSPGQEIYIEFAVDPTNPTDQAIFPANPGGTDTILVTPSGFIPQGEQAESFGVATLGTDCTLIIFHVAYQRIINDMRALPFAYYNIFARKSGETTFGMIGGPYATEESCRDISAPGYTAHTFILRKNVEYFTSFEEQPYPISGGDSAYLGTSELIYPEIFAHGYMYLGGFGGPLFTEMDTVAGADNDYGDYFTQGNLISGLPGVDTNAILLNTLDVDAFCRFEAEPGITLVDNFGLWDTAGAGTWIIAPVPGLDNAAYPLNTFAFARGTTFRASDGAFDSTNVTVDPGKLLNGASAYPTGVPPHDPAWHSVSLTLGGAGLDLDVLPVRVYDDPRESNPGEAGTVTMTAGGWTVDLGFVLQFGTDPALAAYTVEVDTDWDGTWNSAPAGRTHTLTGHVYDVPGRYTDTVSITSASQPAGSYTFALKVTDAAGDEYIYPYDVAHGAMPVVIVAAPVHPWAMFGQNAQHTFRSPYLGPQTNTVRWSFPTGGTVSTSPAIGGDGTVYFGSQDGTFYAINPDGTLKWTFTSGGAYSNVSPALAADGTVYIGSQDCNLYALNPDGSLKWSFPTGDIIYSSPVIGVDGTVYFGSCDSELYALNPDGSLLWQYLMGDLISSTPAIGTDGTIYVGCHDDNVYAINPNGSLKWYYRMPGFVSSSPSIGADGTVYIGQSWGGSNLIAINPDGSKRWSYSTGYWIIGSAGIGIDGTIYIGSMDYYFHAVNPDGSYKWSINTGGLMESSPAIGADGTVYYGSLGGDIFAVNSDGSVKWIYGTGSLVGSSPSIAPDGTLYVCSYDGNLYAFRDP